MRGGSWISRPTPWPVPWKKPDGAPGGVPGLETAAATSVSDDPAVDLRAVDAGADGGQAP